MVSEKITKTESWIPGFFFMNLTKARHKVKTMGIHKKSFR
jgi:hypothetical protein